MTLKVPIQDLLFLHICYTLSQAYHRALMVEKQLVRKAQSSSYNPRPNSHITPISGSNKQVNSNPYNKAALKNFSGSNFACFKCGEMGHKANECSKPLLSKGRTLMLGDVVEVKDFVESNGDELIGGDEEEEEEGLVLVMKKTLLTPRKEDENEWLRGNIFHSTCSILGKVCNLVIDGGSCEKVVSQEAVDKLGLKTEEHPHPYNLSWLKKGGEIKVIKRCMVSFSIWKKYEDVVSCDVVPMDVCHLLLRRPWQYDRDTSHNGNNNTYSLKLNGKKFTLLSMKHKVTQKLDKTLLLIKSFAHDHSDSGCAYMLGADLCANKGGNEVEKNMGDVPSAIKELLEEFGDYTPIELPLGLSPMKNIQHANVSGLEGFKESYKEGGYCVYQVPSFKTRRLGLAKFSKSSTIMHTK